MTDAREVGTDTSATAEVASILPQHECWSLLASTALGRLVTSVDNRPEIFPVNFVVQNRTVLFRTAEGTKLVSTAINNQVVFEADEHNVAEGWSVIVRGTARAVAALDGDDQDAFRADHPNRGHRPPFPLRLTSRLIYRHGTFDET